MPTAIGHNERCVNNTKKQPSAFPCTISGLHIAQLQCVIDVIDV